MPLTQQQIDMLKGKYMSYKDNAPYMRLVFDLKTGGQKAIETPYLTKVTKSNAFNQVGRATIEISSINGKYNYLLDEEWKGVINQKHQKITIIEGYGTWREISFIGYIVGWDMEADGESEVTIKIECVNRLLDINKSIYKGMGLDGSLSLDELREQVISQTNYDLEAQNAGAGLPSNPIQFTTEPYAAPTGDYATTEKDPLLDSWTPVFRLTKPVLPEGMTMGDFKFEFTRQGLLLYNYRTVQGSGDNAINRRHVKAYELVNEQPRLKYNWMVTQVGDYHAFKTNQRQNTAVMLGTTGSYYSNIWITYSVMDKIVVMDFEKGEHKEISVGGDIGRPRGRIKGVVFYDNELYISVGGRVFKTVVDFENGVATNWQEVISIYGINGDNDWDERMQESIVMKGSELMMSLYAPGGGQYSNHSMSETRYYDYMTGELLETKAGKYNVGSHSFYNGYLTTVNNNEAYRVSSLDFSEEYQTDLYRIPSDSPYSFSKDYALHNNELYMFPANFATSSTVDYDFVVFKTKLRFANGGPNLDELNQDYADYLADIPQQSMPTVKPSELLFKEAELQVPQMTVPSNTPALPLLQDIAKDSGQNLYAISQTGQTLLEYPTAKPTPDYTFDTSVDVLSIKHTKSSEIYDQVIVYFGRGNTASMVQMFRTEQLYPGQGGSIYKILKPNFTKTEAENFAKRIIENGLSEELEVSTRTVPNLTIGDTVLVNDRRMIGSYKGVIMQEETDNSLDSGYYAKYKVLRFEG